MPTLAVFQLYSYKRNPLYYCSLQRAIYTTDDRMIVDQQKHCM